MKTSTIFLSLLAAFLSPTASWAAPMTDAGASTATARPTVYIIRHGEKPTRSGDNGLNADGVRRAECLRGVFGKESGYDIGYIMAQTVSKKGKFRRPYDTVHPLATDLGQEIETSCGRNKAECVARKVEEFEGEGNILISWRHAKIDAIARELGVRDPPKYPDYRYDVIWEIPYPYNKITDMRSEECPGLDVSIEL